MSKAMTKSGELKKHLRPGQVYRRADLVRHTNAVDRHLQELVADKTLQKVRNGVYYYPKRASFGDVPPDDEKLVRAFLKDDNFYVASLDIAEGMEAIEKVTEDAISCGGKPPNGSANITSAKPALIS